MGAWGPGSFENDSAHDWLAEIDGVDSVRAALEHIVEADDDEYIEVDEASAVIAAAEIIAAARGHAMKGAPEDLVAWVGSNGKAFTDADAKLAADAIARVQESSELQELWADGGDDNPWPAEVAKLLERLAAKPLARPQ